ncbi:MAG: GNAT family N-acetyltransferase [Clostridia bacterium]|nr:GNAT family N-acetyltransferase [Clostridia bacterium]
MELKTERLTLRPVMPGDEAGIHEYAGDRSITMMYWLPNETFDETVDFVRQSAAEWQSADQTDFAFVILLDGRIIGGCDADLSHSAGRSYATLGWIIHKAYRGRGFASEAARALLDFAFTHLRIGKVYAQCDILNPASFAVMKHIGMTCVSDTGTRTYPRTGVTSGEYTCLITKEEWERLRAPRKEGHTLTNRELRQIYFGAYSFRETPDGWLQAFQYSDAQMAYFRSTFDFWYDRCMASTAKTLEMTTDARTVSFRYRFIWEGSQDSFELAVNGQITEIRYVKDLPKEGRLTFALPEGKKDAVIYLPADATVLIWDFAIDGAFTPARKGKKVLWLGDSITQGYGPLRSGQTYVSVANRLLGWDILNQGIGGYVYDKKSLMKMDGYAPDRIVVALGTNQFGCETMRDVEEYYETLTGIYGTEIPILCVTPLWRGDVPDGLPTLTRFCENVRAIAGRYPNVTVVDGFTLVPHLPEYFLDNLHPNALGCEVYGRNLVEAIRRLGF